MIPSLPSLLTAFLLVGPIFSSFSQIPTSPTDPRDTLGILAEQERQRTQDPATGTVPYERLDAARQQIISQLSATNGAPATTNGGIPNVTWQERGPANVGGRTRSLLFDPNDATHKKVWAGSPAGGLWFTVDITDASAGWTPVSDNWENTVVTTLAADPTNPQVMYAGTGDSYNGVSGGGIWKTTNGGTSWTRLTSTIPVGNYGTIGSAFGYIQRIIVNNSGQVFVATRYGVIRSVDSGNSWAYVLAPNQGIGAGSNTGNYYNDLVTDLELGTDGILYAAFNSSRVFRSGDATGTAWTEITPPGITGERTELALAPSTSGSGQVIYGVSRKYNSLNYGQDVTWFRKSSNGGATWADVVIPTNGSSHFTSGSGSANLNLSVSPTDPNTVYAGGYGWYRSANGGTSWSSQFQNTYQYQQGLFFQPGNSLGAAFATDNGIFWSANWSDNSVTNPTFSNRNSGYRVGEISSVSMKNVPGGAFLLAGSRPDGFVQLTTAGLSAGTIIWSANYPGATFIDEDDPTVRVFQSYSSFYRYGSSGSTQLTSLNSYYTTAAADYDSPSNILYVNDVINSQGVLRKVMNVATTPQSTTFPLSGITSLASYLKLSPDRTKMFMGSNSGKVYKISNLDQATPTVTAIDNGALPQYTSVSCIDVGADENELLVTLSNFGIQSVWYTSNGGVTWTGKDQTNFGLPDVPVRSVLFNTQNRKQVLLGTDVGIWSTSDITATNPGWTYTGVGMDPFRINQLRYRPSDGRVVAATNGRGVWQSDALAIAYTPSTIAITTISNSTLCAGNTVSVSYSTSGPAFTGAATVEVWISDASGNFANQRKIGSGTSSPISVTLATGYDALPYGTNYQVKVVAPAQDVESSPAGALSIGNLDGASILDRINNTGNSICSGSQATLRISVRDGNYNNTVGDSYQWLLNGTPISGATSQTIVAQQAGTYTAQVLQAGCSVTAGSYALYTSTNIYAYVRSQSNGEPQCDDHPLKLSSSYIGESGTYQWTRNTVDIAGANSYTYVATQTGNYSFRLVDGSCTSTAQPSYFQFGRSLQASVYLSSSRYDSLLCSSSSSYQEIPLAADFPSSNDYTVQWYRNGTSIPSATFNYYYAYQPGAYSILLKQGSCETRSNAVTIGTTDQLKVSINYAYNEKAVCSGETRYLYSSVAYGVTLQWQKNGIDIPGATSNNYPATASGDYTVRVTRRNCSAISLPVSLTFSNAIQPKVEFGYFTASEACTNVTLRLADNYNLSGYQYQWYKDDVPVSGAVYTNYSASQSGIYSLKATNGSCTGLSKGVYANVGNGKTSKPTIYSSSADRQLCANNAISLNASTYYGNLQWKRNGVPIPGETRYLYSATQSGLYSVVSQDGSCSAESDPIDVKIGEPTTATLSGNVLVSSGQTAMLPITFTGSAPWSASLTTGESVTATYQNPAFITVSPTTNTTYQLASVVNACGTGSVSGQAVVSVGTGSADVSLNMSISNRTPSVGDVVTYVLTASNAGPDDATGVQLRSILPAGLSFVGSTSPEISVDNGVVTANLGTIPTYSQRFVSFQASPVQPGVFATSAQVIASQTPDPDSQPNSGTEDGQDDVATVDLRTVVDGPLMASANPNQIPLPKVAGNQPVADANTADLSLAMQVDKLTPVANELVNTSITVSNRGGSVAASIIVQVVLPNGTLTGLSPAGWILVSGQTYKRYINALPAGQSATVSFLWQPAGTGTLKAQIFDADVADPDSTPGNGYDNGEDDAASLMVRVR